MNVRCGACRTQFEVPGAGRFACPSCGSVNAVRRASDPPASPPAPPSPSVGGYPAAPGVGPEGAPPPPPPPPPLPDVPSPKITCPECSFSFIVGDVAVASCPMCGEEVHTGREEPEATDE